jgi:hypothetical protein
MRCNSLRPLDLAERGDDFSQHRVHCVSLSVGWIAAFPSVCGVPDRVGRGSLVRSRLPDLPQHEEVAMDLTDVSPGAFLCIGISNLLVWGPLRNGHRFVLHRLVLPLHDVRIRAPQPTSHSYFLSLSGQMQGG